MSRAKLLALLGAGAIAATAIVYFTWLDPDDNDLFSIDAPEHQEEAPDGQAQPGPGQVAERTPRADDDRGRDGRDGAGRRPSGAAPTPASSPTISEPGQDAAEVGVPPAPPSGDQPSDDQPSDDQYADSLTRLLSQVDPG
jgi:hypothetical protein